MKTIYLVWEEELYGPDLLLSIHNTRRGAEITIIERQEYLKEMDLDHVLLQTILRIEERALQE